MGSTVLIPRAVLEATRNCLCLFFTCTTIGLAIGLPFAYFHDPTSGSSKIVPTFSPPLTTTKMLCAPEFSQNCPDTSCKPGAYEYEAGCSVARVCDHSNDCVPPPKGDPCPDNTCIELKDLAGEADDKQILKCEHGWMGKHGSPSGAASFSVICNPPPNDCAPAGIDAGKVQIQGADNKYLQYDWDTKQVKYATLDSNLQDQWYFQYTNSLEYNKGSIYQLIAYDDKTHEVSEHYLHCEGQSACRLNKYDCSRGDPKCSFTSLPDECNIKKIKISTGCLTELEGDSVALDHNCINDDNLLKVKMQTPP